MSAKGYIDETQFRQAILNAIDSHKVLYGTFPKQGWIAWKTGHSQASVSKHFRILLAEGYIERYHPTALMAFRVLKPHYP